MKITEWEGKKRYKAAKGKKLVFEGSQKPYNEIITDIDDIRETKEVR